MGVLVRGALLAEMAGGLVAEMVFSARRRVISARAVFRRARSDSAVARWAAARVVADRDGAARMRLIRSRMAGRGRARRGIRRLLLRRR